MEVSLGSCVECWVEQKARPNSQHKFRKYFCVKYFRSDFYDKYPYFNGFLKLRSWDFAFMLGLANMSGDLGLGTCVNWPSNGSLFVTT